MNVGVFWNSSEKQASKLKTRDPINVSDGCWPETQKVLRMLFYMLALMNVQFYLRMQNSARFFFLM